MFLIMYKMIVKKLDTVGPKHPLETEHASRSADFQDTGNQINALHQIKIKTLID